MMSIVTPTRFSVRVFWTVEADEEGETGARFERRWQDGRLTSCVTLGVQVGRRLVEQEDVGMLELE